MYWKTKTVENELLVDSLSVELGINKKLVEILVDRGVDTFEKARQFFKPTLEDLNNPFLMKDMGKAVQRIERAVQNQENILIYGDYDVDGTTAVALMYSYLKTFYTNLNIYIPDRYTEGYGISKQGIDYAYDNNFTLIIALDCGIKEHQKIEYAKAKGIDFVIGDHHLPGNIIPDAVAVLDPKREDCDYPYKELCGCGIGFKMIQAIAQHRGESLSTLVPYLDLVAIAIAADIVPITQENRVLAKFGLMVLNQNPRVGVKALLKILGKKEISIHDIVFGIAPRINAAGRIDHASKVVKLLVEQDSQKASELAFNMEQYNQDRRELDEQITQEALEQIQSNEEQQLYTTVVFSENWHKGVIGIVASRLIETYYRPTIVFTKSNGKLVASARSVKGFDIHQALESCSEYIEQFGGHKFAAGLTISEDKFVAFKDKFEQVVRMTISEESRMPQLTIDAIIDFKDIDPKFVRLLKRFEPHGPQNMSPVFLTKAVSASYSKIGKDKNHLRIEVKQADSEVIKAIGFNMIHKEAVFELDSFAMAYTIGENIWNNTITLQLNVKDVNQDIK
ncbi:MAG: single-stranded-DNA-specific exonuclease RecJ [Bacteroidota bacterium]|nr:single-stranded-DNA-specific exonuclease RecJ [Bacteroidota bacterium]